MIEIMEAGVTSPRGNIDRRKPVVGRVLLNQMKSGGNRRWGEGARDGHSCDLAVMMPCKVGVWASKVGLGKEAGGFEIWRTRMSNSLRFAS